MLLVTGLVFFGNYAYQNFIVAMHAAGKVSLLYAASFTLLGLGWWWQRKKVKESLRNYGQVLFAGGLAMVYFTTYAAHHFNHLRIIESPVWDGALLLAWAGYMVWIADRRKSQVLALFAVLLAYYSAVITHVGQFTLYSNLVLTLAALFFMVRNRWAVLSFTSLTASYAAYGYWRFFRGEEWHWASVDDGLWTGTYFLIAYWIVFTAAVFLSRDEKFAGSNRSSFLTLNNGAFFTMFLLTMYQVHHAGFWKFSLIFGIVLIVLAEFSRRMLRAEPLAANSYLTQGLLLGTIGLISNPHLAGLNLALVLAAESVTLLLAGHQRKNLIMLVGAYGSAALAVGWGMDGMLQHEPRGLWLGVGLGAIMVGNTLLVHREYRVATSDFLRPQVSYFTVLALTIWWVATYDNINRIDLPLMLALEGVLFGFSIYLLQIREISVFGLLYLTLAQALWVYDVFAREKEPGWWHAGMMVLLAICTSQWWQRQRILENRPDGSRSEPGCLAALMKNAVLLAAAMVAFRMTGGWQGIRLSALTWHTGYVPIGLGVLMLADVLLADRQSAANRATGLRGQSSYSFVLALIVWLAVTWHHTSRESLPLVLAAEGVLLTLSFYVLLVPEIAVLSQGYVILAQLAWLFPVIDGATPPQWWNPILLLAMTLGLSHWWQKQKSLTLPWQAGELWQGVYAAAIIAVIFYWLGPQVAAARWLALTSALAIGITAYGVFTRAWLLAAFGQFFLAVSIGQFVLQLGRGKPQWWVPLAPIAALGFLSWATWQWFQKKPDASRRISQPLLHLAQLYRWVGLVMSLWWVGKYIPDREQIWFLALLNFLVFVLAGCRSNREVLVFAAAYAIAEIALFWMPGRAVDRVYLPNLFALLALFAEQRIAKGLPGRYQLDPRIQGAMIIIGGLSIWLLIYDWVVELTGQTGNQGGYLTASYSVLGLIFFTTGILLRERVYRWLGLGILAFCLARVMVIDVWKLELLYKVLSCMALGIVILVLGFIYNKYQEKIKEWL